MIFKDFIGNEVKTGDFFAYPGAGNAKAEYGMILYKITGFDEVKKKIKAVRLYVDYAYGADRRTFHPLHEKNAIIGEVDIPDHYSTNGGEPIKGRIAVRWSASAIENTNKIALVHPPQFIQDFFNQILEGKNDFQNFVSIQEIGYWILGSTHVEITLNK
jgi:hypothetical protein